MARNAARISALTEAKTRLIAGRDEAQAAAADAESALAELPPSGRLEDQLAAIRTEIEGKRAQLAEVRAEAQALAREAELADRRLAAIATDRQAWSERRDRAIAQIATLETRSAEAKHERAALADAPAIFAEKRRALISEIEAAEADPPRGRRPPGRSRERARRRATARCAPRSRRSAPPARRPPAPSERVEGAKRRLTDIAHEIREMLEVEPDAVADLAGIEPDTALPDVADGRGRTRTAAARPRAARRRQPARRGRAARDRDPAHHADHRARRPGRGDQAAAPGHP